MTELDAVTQLIEEDFPDATWRVERLTLNKEAPKFRAKIITPRPIKPTYASFGTMVIPVGVEDNITYQGTATNVGAALMQAYTNGLRLAAKRGHELQHPGDVPDARDSNWIS